MFSMVIKNVLKKRIPYGKPIYKTWNGFSISNTNLQHIKLVANYSTGDDKGGKKDKNKDKTDKKDGAKKLAKDDVKKPAKDDAKKAAKDDATKKPAKDDPKKPEKTGDKPSGRISRIEPGKVILGFIPADWATFFHKSTGVTGFYTFCVTFGIYLMSKEKLVMEHEYYGGLSTVVLWWVGAKYIGPGIAKALDKEIDAYETAWNEGRVNERNMLNESIEDESKLQESSEGQLILVEAKRENVMLQLEAAFRERQMKAYLDVKRILDYNVQVEEIERRIAHHNMVQWVRDKVVKSITDDHYDNVIDKCLNDLDALSTAKGKGQDPYGGGSSGGSSGGGGSSSGGSSGGGPPPAATDDKNVSKGGDKASPTTDDKKPQ